MEKVKLAQKRFESGCNCAQSTLFGLASNNVDENILEMISSHFGGGIARQGSTCGAVSGALMALGLKYGYTNNNQENKQVVYEKAQLFIHKFKELHGTDQCSALVGYEMGIPEERSKAVEAGVIKVKCPQYVSDAVEIMDMIIEGK